MRDTRGKHGQTPGIQVGSGQVRSSQVRLGTGYWGTRVYMANFPLKAKFGGGERRGIKVFLSFLTIFWHRAH